MKDEGKKFYFILCKGELVTYTDEEEKMELFLRDRTKLGLISNYKVESYYDFDLPEPLRIALDNIGNRDGNLTMVIQGSYDITFALSTRDESIMIDYYDSYLANFSELYDKFLTGALNFKMTDIEKEVFEQARDSIDEFSTEYLLSSHPEDSVFEEYDVLDPYEVFRHLLTLGIIA